MRNLAVDSDSKPLEAMLMTNHGVAGEFSGEAVALIGGPGFPALDLRSFEAVVRGRRSAVLDDAAAARVHESRKVLERCIDEQRVVYGVTTGFGPLADRVTPGARVDELQRNLIYHLASGVGRPLPWHEARGLMLARLVSIAQGASGASPLLADLMLSCLNAGLAPFIPEKGTVGASGDLTPSAHMALALMGEGAFIDRAGATLTGRAALDALSLEPYSLEGRDGLALVNGTSAMTAIAAINAVSLSRLIDAGFALSAVHAEIFEALGEAWHPAFAELRSHPGQIEAHRRLALLIEGSRRIRTGRVASQSLQTAQGDPAARRIPQDPYTIRCVPQILGAVLDSLTQHDSIVERELNSVTDNPVLLAEEPYALHGGNFFGQHVAFAADHLANAASMLAILSERQIARVTDERLSGLPAFLQPNETGLRSGFMGAQVTASALIAEIRTRAIPASIQSVPTNGNNQDVVSMGTIAARRCRDIIEDAARILAIQALALAQTIDIIGRDRGFSPAALHFYDGIRLRHAYLVEDRPLSGEIEKLAGMLLEGGFPPAA
jgi:tyrosine ammonia-lyase